MAAKKKLTKRQILTKLLEVEEKREQLSKSEQRLWARQEKISDQREELANQLRYMCLTEQKKAGEGSFTVKDPILFKDRVFTFSSTNQYGEDNLTIKPIKTIK